MKAATVVNKLLENDVDDPKPYIAELGRFLATEGDYPCSLNIYHIAPDGFWPSDDPDGFSMIPMPHGWTNIGTVKTRAADMTGDQAYAEMWMPKERRPPEAYQVIKFNDLKPAQVAKIFPDPFPSIDAAGRAFMAKLKR